MYDWVASSLQHTRWTVKNIEPFIKKHRIDMSEFEPVIYRSYGEFSPANSEMEFGRFRRIQLTWGLSPRLGILGGKSSILNSSFQSRVVPYAPTSFLEAKSARGPI